MEEEKRESIEENSTHKLERLMKLLRKGLAFEYKDEFFKQDIFFVFSTNFFSFFQQIMHRYECKVSYPMFEDSVQVGQHLLEKFWSQISNIYFHPLSDEEIQHLTYVQNIVNTPLPDQTIFRGSSGFWSLLTDCIQPSYLHHQYLNPSLSKQNWLTNLYFYYHMLSHQSPFQKSLSSTLSKIKRQLYNRLSSEKQYKIYCDFLKNNSIESPIEEESYVQEIITFYEQQLKEINQENRVRVQRLMERVFNEVDQTSKSLGDREIDSLWEKVQENSIVKDYLKMQIEKLEKRQVAESIAKIFGSQDSNEEFFLEMEPALGVGKVKVGLKSLFQYHKARDISLFHPYLSGQKSHNTYIASNLVQFEGIQMKKQQKIRKTISKIMLDLHQYVPSPEIVRKFQKFEMCHHCRCLVPRQFLLECQYDSDRHGTLRKPYPFYDSYEAQVEERNPNAIWKYSFRHNNTYHNYRKVNGEFICGRKFCLSCLEGYDTGFNRNGLCLVCQKRCLCSRCCRDEIISKLKGMYSLLGGKPVKDSSDPLFQTHQPPRKQTKHRRGQYGRGTRMQTTRENMEHLRILTDMVWRREKKKLKFLETRKERLSIEMKLLLQKNNMLHLSHIFEP